MVCGVLNPPRLHISAIILGIAMLHASDLKFGPQNDIILLMDTYSRPFTVRECMSVIMSLIVQTINSTHKDTA